MTFSGTQAKTVYAAGILWLSLAGCGGEAASLSDAERDQRFEEMMTGVSLVGQSKGFSRDGLTDGEEYVIDSVTKMTGSTWLFQVRMKFRGNEIPVPIPIPIEWAGDTPVISMTDVAIPGMGTYTARVLLFREHYSGMWSGQGGGGGHVFGKIVRKAAQ